MLCCYAPLSSSAPSLLLLRPQRWRRPSTGLVCGATALAPQQQTVVLRGKPSPLRVPATAAEEEETTDTASEIVRYLSLRAAGRRMEEVLGSRFDALLTSQVVEDVVRKLAAVEADGEIAYAFFQWAGKRHRYAHSTSSYNLMLGLLGRKLKLALRLLNQMQTQQCPLDKQTLALLAGMLGGEAQDGVEARLEAAGFKLNSFGQDCVLGALVEEQRLDMACVTCKRMLKAGDAVEPSTATVLVRQLCRLGRVDLLPDLLHHLRHSGLRLSEVTYTECMQAFGKAGNAEAALDLFQQMRAGSLSCRPDKVAFSAAMRWLCEAQRVDDAKGLMEEMHGSGCPPDVVSYNTLIAGYCKAGDAEAALQVFRSMSSSQQQVRANVVTYDTLIMHLCKMCRAGLAFEMFSRMVEAGFRPDVNVCNTLIHCSCKVGLLREAAEICRQMRTQGIARESFTYGILINSHAKAGLIREALEFVELCQRDGFSPSTINLNLVIQGLVKSGKVGRAIELFRRSLKQPDIFTYNLLISGQGKSGNVDAVWQLLSEMQAAGCRPDMCTFNTVLHSLRRACRMHEYRRLLVEMRRQGARPTQQMVGVIVTTLATTPGYMAEAIRYLNQAVDDDGCVPENSTYNLLVGELCKAHDFEAACDVFLGMASFSPATCNLLLRKLIVARRRTDIGRLLLETSGRGIELRSYLIALLYKLGRLDDAVEQFGAIRSTGLPISPPTYGYAISSLCKSNRLPDAMAVFEEIQVAGLELDVYTYSVLMDALSKAGQPDQAVRIFHQMNKSGCCQPDVVVYNVLIGCLGKHGRIDEALAVFEQMRVTPDARTYNVLIDVLSSCGRFERAYAFFGTMRRMMKQQQQAADVVTFNTVLKALKRLGRHDEVYQLFQEMQGECCPNLVTFGTVMDSLAKAGRLEEAEQLVSKLQEMGYACNSCIYNSLLKGFCRSGDLLRAYQLFQAMPAPLVDVVTYKILVLGFSKAGQADMAVQMFQEMRRKGHAASVVTYNVLIRCLSAAGRNQEAYSLFQEMIRKGFAPDAVTYSVLPNRDVCKQPVEAFYFDSSSDDG